MKTLFPTDKSSDNISFVCKKLYFRRIKADSSFTMTHISPRRLSKNKRNFFKILAYYWLIVAALIYFRYITSTTKAIKKPPTRILGCIKNIEDNQHSKHCIRNIEPTFRGISETIQHI